MFGPLLLLSLASCLPEKGRSPDGPGGAGGTPAHQAAVPASRELSPLPFPRPAPTDAWIRTTPATLVNERGEQVLVIQGSHTRVAVERLFPDRAFVTCTGCRTPVQGWVQRALLLPEGYEGSPAERADLDLSLALFIAQARKVARDGGTPRGLEVPPSPLDAFLALLDQGFAPDRTRAIAPPWGGEPGFEGSRALALHETDGWRFVEVVLRPTASGSGEPAQNP